MFEFLEDNYMVEWWDCDFRAWYYQPYRDRISRAFEAAKVLVPFFILCTFLYTHTCVLRCTCKGKGNILAVAHLELGLTWCIGQEHSIEDGRGCS